MGSEPRLPVGKRNQGEQDVGKPTPRVGYHPLPFFIVKVPKSEKPESKFLPIPVLIFIRFFPSSLSGLHLLSTILQKPN